MPQAATTASAPTGSEGGSGIADSLLARLPASVADRLFLESRYYDGDGWRYLLPELAPGAVVVCLDARLGTTTATLARHHGAAISVHPDADLLGVMQQRLRSMKVPGVSYVRVPPGALRLPFASDSVDAVILHDIGGVLVGDERSDGRVKFNRATLAEVRRVLKPHGFAYFGLSNRFGYQRLLRRRLSPGAGDGNGPTRISPVHAQSLARSAGFAALRLHPYAVENGLVCEVLQRHGYRSHKNSFTRSERFKERLLGRHGARFLAPAFGLVCFRDEPLPSRCELIAGHLARSGLLADGVPDVRRYLPLPGKIVLSLGPESPATARRIVVLPLQPKYVEWRRREIEVIRALRRLPSPVSTRFPAVYEEFSYGNETGFVLSEIPGITVDRHVPRIAEANAHALDFLIEFHRLTARRTPVDDRLYGTLCGYILDNLRRTYTDLGAQIARMDRLLQARLLHRPLTVVWLHGDYKLENLIIDPGTLSVNGVIDWELSREEGLPLLDPLYLLTYDRMMRDGSDFLSVYRNVIQPGRLDAGEQAMLARYLQAIALSEDVQQVLRALFFLHHIGCRYVYDRRDAHSRSLFVELLERTERDLEAAK